jgi:hypothetical protein
MDWSDLNNSEKLERLFFSVCAMIGIIFDIADTEIISFVLVAFWYAHAKFVEARIRVEALTKMVAQLKDGGSD